MLNNTEQFTFEHMMTQVKNHEICYLLYIIFSGQETKEGWKIWGKVLNTLDML